MNPIFFPKQADFRKWFQKNHETEKELLVGFYKVDSGKSSITWPQSVDEALCFGWIDGIRRSIDKESYCIRFTPRKSTSIWSAINIKKVEDLTEKGLMYPAGFKAFAKRKENKSKIYAYEMESLELSAQFEKTFKANKKAWANFTSMPPSYKKTAIHIIMTAKQDTTRITRLHELISASEAGEKIKRLDYQKKKLL
ncbi:MAG: YdeI/OmpD-associated family protein [Bacteroidota bacterium]